MVRAFLFFQWCSWRNRVWSKLCRLRKPQYLLGMLAGVAYFGLFLVRPWGSPRPAEPPNAAPDSAWPGGAFAAVGEPLLATGLLLAVALTWLLPSKRAGLDFSEAEIAWFFPAPIARRTLVHFRLVRTQAGLVLSALVLSLVSTAAAQRTFDGRMVIGWWAIMSALELHRQAAGFVRTRLLDRGLPNLVRRGVVLALMAGVAALFLQAARAGRVLEADGVPHPEDLAARFAEMAQAPSVAVVLFPFRLLARPLMAAPEHWPWVLVPVLGLLGGLYWWALVSAVGFEDEALERASMRERLMAAARTGNWHLARPGGREGSAPFRLRPRGFRLLALTWKNLIAARTFLASPLAIVMGLAGLVVFGSLVVASPGARLPRVLAAILVMLGPMIVLVGPELTRFDLRQDLTQADLLKTYPLKGWQLIWGQILAPLTMLTSLQWLLIAASVLGFSGMGAEATIPLSARVGVGCAAAFLAPAVSAALLLLHNGTALLFPAWVKLGPGGAQGFEAMGQRMLLMLAHLAGLGMALLLPAGAGTALFFAGTLLLPWTLALVLAAVGATTVLAVEIALGLKWLGDWFERMDLTD
jgi:hypothetical protein